MLAVALSPASRHVAVSGTLLFRRMFVRWKISSFNVSDREDVRAIAVVLFSTCMPSARHCCPEPSIACPAAAFGIAATTNV